MSHVVNEPAVPSPAVGGDEPHTHPLPRWVRALLLAFAASAVLTFGGLWALYLEHLDDARQREADHVERERELQEQVAAIWTEIDRRTAARDAQQREQRAETTAAVCAVLPDLPSPSEDVQRLSRALGCPVE